MYAASVSWIVLSNSFRAASLRLRLSLIFESLSVKRLSSCARNRMQVSGEAHRWLDTERGSPRQQRTFWILAFSSSCCKIWRFTSSRFSRKSPMPATATMYVSVRLAG